MGQKHVVFRNCYLGDLEYLNALLQFKYNKINFLNYYLKSYCTVLCEAALHESYGRDFIFPLFALYP